MVHVSSLKMMVMIGCALFSAFLLAGCGQSAGVQRIGSVIGIPPENIPEYKRLHADAWPGVLKMIRQANIRNYSIYLGEVEPQKYCLFSYYEYVGDDFDADMARIGEDETTKKWWTHTDPLQKPLPTRQDGEWWAQWREVFHFAGSAMDRPPTSRHGGIIGIGADDLLAYNQMHASVWPGVLEAIEKANIRNYSIYEGQIAEGEYLLFSYFEYYGDDFAGDMKGIADNEITQKWWTYTEPLQQPLSTRQEGEWWASMEEVFHTD